MDAVESASAETAAEAEERSAGNAERGSEEPMIRMDALSLRTSRSPVFTDVSAQVAEGGLLVIRGADGTGKTCLLLTIAGRMHASSGTALVHGFDARKQGRKVRREVGISHVHGVTDLDENLTVAAHIAERLIGLQPWYKPWVSKAAVRWETDKLRDVVASAMSILRESFPGGMRPADVLQADFILGVSEQTYVSELSQLQQFYLQLALTSLDHNRVMAIDDIDLLRDPRERLIAWLGVLLYRRDGVFRKDTQTFIVTCTDTQQLEYLCDAVPDLTGDLALVDLARAAD